MFPGPVTGPEKKPRLDQTELVGNQTTSCSCSSSHAKRPVAVAIYLQKDQLQLQYILSKRLLEMSLQPISTSLLLAPTTSA